MQFVTNGPEIPNELLQAHEDGRVVFFCGAGISFPAGLKGFDWLVNELLLQLGKDKTPLIVEALKKKHYDIALDLIERDLPGNRFAVRQELINILRPNYNKKNALNTHKALLELAYSNKEGLRIVTTNFDCLFKKAASEINFKINSFSAPLLPIPKSSKWNGLVYLHGVLPEEPSEQALNQLVLTSGDFGLAYLTERWASRFVSELFRNFVVCFIGYGINDPVLRYMMDALAADRMMGESNNLAYALGNYKPGQEKSTYNEWKAKGVIPILYENSKHFKNHTLLHKTIKNWAELYRDGVTGVERVIVDYALTKPSDSTIQDDYIGRMLWALSHKSGLAAKRFAEFNPVPAIDWLEVFADQKFCSQDLCRFGFQPDLSASNDFKFSLINRPSSIKLSPTMSLNSFKTFRSNWDPIMHHIANWLLRHLNNPKLVLWFAKQGSLLHPNLISLIERHINYLLKMNQEGNFIELDRIKKNAPDAIPNSEMIKLWRILLLGKFLTIIDPNKLLNLLERMKIEEFSQNMRFDLRELLSPIVILKDPYRFNDNPLETNAQEISQLVEWELVLSSRSAYNELHGNNNDWWNKNLPYLYYDFQQLLLDALYLQQYMGSRDEYYDKSFWDLPSISPHEQNRGYHDWILLIELVRDSWLSIKGQDEKKAKMIAANWFDLPFLAFKRLAFFAASKDDIIPPKKWVAWLLEDNHKYLWSIETRREVLRLLVLQGCKLSKESKVRLERAVVNGPLSKESDANEETINNLIWLRLAKLKQSGLALSKAAQSKFDELRIKYPKWKISSDERDEFALWMYSERESSGYRTVSTDEFPTKKEDLIKWIKENINITDIIKNRNWRFHCTEYSDNVGFALFELIKENIKPANLWNEAFYAWTENETLCCNTWKRFSPNIINLTDDILIEIAKSITYWLKKCSKNIIVFDKNFLNICERILNLPLDSNKGIFQNGEPIDQPVSEAINHPVGQLTEAIIKVWFNSNPQDNETIQNEIKLLLSQLCNVDHIKFRHGRVILASQTIALFRVDRDWFNDNLLPHFDWGNNPQEARAIWEGFLWSPRIYPPIITELKFHILETANHYSELNEFGRQYVMFLTFVTVDYSDVFTLKELRKVYNDLPQEGLEEALTALIQILESAEEKRGDSWKNRIKPFWDKVWPKSNTKMSQRVSESIAILCLLTDIQFESAIETLIYWLHPIDYPGYQFVLLDKNDLCNKFPEASLRFLNQVIGDHLIDIKSLDSCLSKISISEPNLKADIHFKRLLNLVEMNKRV